MFDLKSTVYMARISCNQKPYRKTMMRIYGGEVFSSPSERTEAGREFMPDPIHAGGLRYHVVASIVSSAVSQGLIEAVAYYQKEIFYAALTFANTEGIIIALETAHAVKAVIDEAKKCKERKESKVILFNLSGHGLLDLKGHEDYLDGNLG